MRPSAAAELGSVTFGFATDVGLIREENEDNGGIWAVSPSKYLMVVADGMGGAQGGATASKLTVETILAEIPSVANAVDDADRVRRLIERANDKVFRTGRMHRELAGMGTTVVIAICDMKRATAVVGHVGDSRAYQFVDRRGKRLTEDHSLLAETLRAHPRLSMAERSAIPPNVVTRAIGAKPDAMADITEINLGLRGSRARPGSALMLCSDGLTGMVDDRRIAEIATDPSAETQTAAKNLIHAALMGGGQDNVTVALARFRF